MHFSSHAPKGSTSSYQAPIPNKKLTCVYESLMDQKPKANDLSHSTR